MKRLLAALLLTAAIGGIARTAHAIDTVPLPERPVYTRTTYTYRILIPQIGFRAFPWLLR